MIKNELWKRRQTTEVEMSIFRGNQVVKETILLEEIQKNNTREQKVQKELEKDNKQAYEDNKVAYMNRKIYVPNNKRIQQQILQENHNTADIGHLEQKNMLDIIKRNYW